MPLVFYGTKSVTFNEKAGDPTVPAATPVQCPACGQLAVFAPKRVKRFCHIFWIPLIPISGFQHVLECQACHAKFVRTPEQSTD